MFFLSLFLLVLINCFLPISLLIRDWKFADRRTRKYRSLTKILLAGWFACGIFSSVFLWNETRQNTVLQERVSELVQGKDKLLQNISSLSDQIEAYQNEIQIKDQKIAALEQKSNILRTLSAKIECVLAGKWKAGGHPGRLIPVSWNKSQAYVQLLQREDEPSRILLYLTSLDLGNIQGT